MSSASQDIMRWWTAAVFAILVGCGGKTVVSVPEPDETAERATTDETIRAPSSIQAVVAPQTLSGKRALFADAYYSLHSRRFREAARLFEALQPIYPEVTDYVLHYLATCRLQEGSREEAYRLWAQLQASYPRSLLTAEAALEQARILRQRGELPAARELLGIAPEERLEREVDWELAEIALAEGDVDGAHERFMRIRQNMAGTSLGNRAKQRVVELRRANPRLTPIGNARASEVWLLVREGDQQAALSLAEELLRDAPEWQRPERLRALSDAQRAAGHFEKGMETLRSVYTDYPDSAAARGALYRYASILWNRDRDAEAQQAFELYRQRYPGDSSIPEVEYAIARIKEAAGERESAVKDYAGLTNRYPQSKQGREAAWRIAWIRYRQGKGMESAQAFARLADKSTNQDRMAARYWRARSLGRSGNADAARTIYRQILETEPTNYYAYWAEQHLGIRPAVVRSPRSPEAARSYISTDIAPGDFHLTRARELQAADLRSLARAELKAFERSQQMTSALARFLVDSYPAVDGYRDAIRLAPKAGDRRDEILYPLAFWPLIRQHTTSAGIDPFMVLALMRQESLFDPAARSPADARGAMQLLPRTAEQVAERIGRPSPADDDLYEPEVNIPLGIAHLGELHTRYNGNWLEILAAYNGGEGAANKWKERFGTLDGDEFVESITYRETRDYVKRVFTHYRHYQEIYAPDTRFTAQP